MATILIDKLVIGAALTDPGPSFWVVVQPVQDGIDQAVNWLAQDLAGDPSDGSIGFSTAGSHRPVTFASEHEAQQAADGLNAKTGMEPRIVVALYIPPDDDEFVEPTLKYDIMVSFCPGADMSEWPRNGKVVICAVAAPEATETEVVAFLREILDREFTIVGIEARNENNWRRACIAVDIDFEALRAAGVEIMEEFRSMTRECEAHEAGGK